MDSYSGEKNIYIVKKIAQSLKANIYLAFIMWTQHSAEN